MNVAMTSVTYLQQTSADQLRAAARAELGITRVFPADPGFNARMYREIGADWNWVDRLEWSEGRWAAYCSDPCISTLRAAVDGEVAGYAELRMSPCDPDSDSIGSGSDDGVDGEFVYFGLLPGFTWRGLG